MWLLCSNHRNLAVYNWSVKGNDEKARKTRWDDKKIRFFIQQEWPLCWILTIWKSCAKYLDVYSILMSTFRLQTAPSTQKYWNKVNIWFRVSNKTLTFIKRAWSRPTFSVGRSQWLRHAFVFTLCPAVEIVAIPATTAVFKLVTSSQILEGQTIKFFNAELKYLEHSHWKST